jgi:hypothetical protein
VAADPLEEHLERRAVMQVLAGMDLVADIDARLLEGVEDRSPALGQLIERRLDQAGRPLRPRIEIGPGQGAGEGGMLGDAEPARRLGGELALLDRPGGARLRPAAHLRCGEAVEGRVVGGMHGDQLALQMRRQLGHLQAALGQDPLHLVAISLALGRLLQIEQPPVPAGDLQALEAELRGPVGDGWQAVERRRVAGELGEEDGRAFDRLHLLSSLVEGRCPAVAQFVRYETVTAGVPFSV